MSRAISASVVWLNGLVTVDPQGSAWTCTGQLTVGSSGSGTLEVAGSGTIKSSTGWVNSPVAVDERRYNVERRGIVLLFIGSTGRAERSR